MTTKTKKGRKEATTFEKPETATPSPEAATPVETPDTTAAPAPKRGRKPNAEATEPSGGLTMAEFADRYIAALRDAGKGLGTQFSYSIDIQTAVRHFGAETSVASLTTRKVENYFGSEVVTKTRSGRQKAKPGIDKTRRVLRLALEWAAAEGLIPEAPIPESAKPRTKKGEAA